MWLAPAFAFAFLSTGLGNSQDVGTPILAPPGWTADILVTSGPFPAGRFLGEKLVARRDEAVEKVDLNGDGDTRDLVSAVFDLDDLSSTLGMAYPQGVRGLTTRAFSSDPMEDRWLWNVADENAQGATDLNGDGGADDFAPFLLDVQTGPYTAARRMPAPSLRLGGWPAGGFDGWSVGQQQPAR